MRLLISAASSSDRIDASRPAAAVPPLWATKALIGTRGALLALAPGVLLLGLLPTLLLLLLDVSDGSRFFCSGMMAKG